MPPLPFQSNIGSLPYWVLPVKVISFLWVYVWYFSPMITLRIKETAEERGIKTAYQLQKALGIPPAMAARLWKGQLEMIGLKTINRLCNALNCRPGTLFDYEPDNK